MTRTNLEKALRSIGLNWELLDEDNEGQIIIYTGLQRKNDDLDPELVAFEPPDGSF